MDESDKKTASEKVFKINVKEKDDKGDTTYKEKEYKVCKQYF